MYHNRSRGLVLSLSKGFTLIELLVVIAIIGVLSAVVLASLNTARSKGNDAAIQSDLSTIRIQAELYYTDNSNSYGTLSWTTGAGCYPSSGPHMFANTGTSAAIAKALSAADSTNGSTKSVGCASAGSSYVVAAELTNATTAQYYCVDSTGNGKVVTGTIASMSVCPP